MRDRYDELEGAGAEVAAIGMGTVEMAADFARSSDIPFPLLVDTSRDSYAALEIKKGSWTDVIGPKIWSRGIAAIRQGHKLSTMPKQDPRQLGGAAVIAPGGEVKYLYKATNSSEIADVDELLGALA